MTEEELLKLESLNNAAIIAPAGHGKTEMIVDIVEHSTKRQLLLTHTNAGVAAIVNRLNKRKIPKEKYFVTTIAAFCIKWCMSYKFSANIDLTLSPLVKGQSGPYYSQMYKGAKLIFENFWAGEIMRKSYGGIIVDEYQDCIQEQQEIFVALNQFLPVIVLGDPMQGIFSFAGKLVDWKSLPFEIVDIQTQPWRWKKTNRQLGNYLSEIRASLLPILDGKRCTLCINSCDGCVEIISRDQVGYKLLKDIQQYKNIVFITKWPNQQLGICQEMPGIFQYDEVQDCKELFNYSEKFDNESGAELYLSVIGFAACCMTHVNVELTSFLKKLQNNVFEFSRITKHADFGDLLISEIENNKYNQILKILYWFENNCSTFKLYRAELFHEMIRSIEFACNNGGTIFDAATSLRRNSASQNRYSNFKYLSSRTLLSKGLEFDCVIIDMTSDLSAKDFYVAMTRAMKKIYIISDTNKFVF